MIATFTYTNPAGCTYRVRVENVASVADEPYPPGGFLRVLRDDAGRVLAGPHVDELTSWDCQPEGSTA